MSPALCARSDDLAPSIARRCGATVNSASRAMPSSPRTSGSIGKRSADVRRLLMISPHFPPDSSAGTHRVRLLAPHLETYGWTPTVLTVAAEDYESRLDPELASLVPASLDVVRSRALPARLTRRLGIGDLGLRALPGPRRGAWELLRSRPFHPRSITVF